MDKRGKLGFTGVLLALITFVWIVQAAVSFREKVRDMTDFFSWLFADVLFDPIALGVYALVAIVVILCWDDIREFWRPSPQLDLFFETPSGGFGGNRLDYEPVTLTNRSERTMNVDFVAVIDYFDDSGQPRRISVPAEWGEYGSKTYCASGPIELDARRSKQGRIIIFLPEPAKIGIQRWNLLTDRNIYIEASDSVSGTRIVFKPTPGNHRGKMPYPLPPVTELLAPKASESTTPNPRDQTP